MCSVYRLSKSSIPYHTAPFYFSFPLLFISCHFATVLVYTMDRMDTLVEENAANSRRLMGGASLDVLHHSGDLDIRRAVLNRSSYPYSAPPVAQCEKRTEDNKGTLIVTEQKPAPKKTGEKRFRENTEDDIIDMDAHELKAKHALVISDEARKQRAEEQYTPPKDWKVSKILIGHQGRVNDVAVDPSNSWFASASFDQIIKVWDLSTGQLKVNLTGHTESVNALAISAISPYMFSGGDDHSIKCWDLETKTITRDFFGHRKSVQSVAVHPTLNLVVSAGADRQVRVWDIRSRSCVHILEGHKSGVLSVTTQESEPQVISGGSDGFVYLWDLKTGKAMRTLTQHKKPVRGLTFNVERNRLITCGADDIRVWDMPSGDYICSTSAIVNRPGEAAGKSTEEIAYRWSCCAMSPRNVLAVGSLDEYVGFYDWKQPQPVQPISVGSVVRRVEHYTPFQLKKTKSITGTLQGEGGVLGAAFDVSGTRFITAESDKSIKIWLMKE
ncbi:pleiotropic regulator 1 [Angomonas deanei]|nr:pleiotropic regulator 1 [Angomonas deanei]|eukprot:EPY36549.1 pleiotropic regulator 1 [Angomonas deanei]